MVGFIVISVVVVSVLVLVLSVNLSHNQSHWVVYPSSEVVPGLQEYFFFCELGLIEATLHSNSVLTSAILI